MIPARKWAWVERSFRAYNRRYLRKSFHRLHLDGDLAGLKGDGKTPLLVCLSHSSWWDLLLGVFLAERLPAWDSYAPMDEVQLRRYLFFRHLGVIGVDRSGLHGAREFVDYCRTLLEGRPRALWITPQGEFTSNDARPVRFQPGMGWIAQSLSAFYTATVVFDYEFWSEKRPEAFISVRPPVRVEVGPDFDRRAYTRVMERRLEDHLEELACLRRRRDPALFTTLMESSGGVSPVFDAVAATAARVRGGQRRSSHGEVLTPRWRELRK